MSEYGLKYVHFRMGGYVFNSTDFESSNALSECVHNARRAPMPKVQQLPKAAAAIALRGMTAALTARRRANDEANNLVVANKKGADSAASGERLRVRVVASCGTCGSTPRAR